MMPTGSSIAEESKQITQVLENQAGALSSTTNPVA
jgi:hypothetical protein